MRRVLIVAFVAALCLGATNAFAGTQDNAVIALHAELHPTKGGDPCAYDGSACSDFVTEWPLSSSADLYLLVARGDAGPGIAAASCGITYGGGPAGLRAEYPRLARGRGALSRLADRPAAGLA